MDWATSEWKNDLTPLALQKVNSLEDKIEKLKKEKSQLEYKLIYSSADLEKEQRKVEKKTEEVSVAQRDLKSLQNVCNDLEDKLQKLSKELQNKDARINSLEGIVTKQKNESLKLQQQERDFKMINESLNKSKSNREKNRSILVDLYDEPNNSIIKEREMVKEQADLKIERLNEKIIEQEALIKELKLKIETKSEECFGPSSGKFFSSTPAKPRKPSALDSSISFTDNFSYVTPAKMNRDKILKYQNETSTVDSGNEKIINLEAKLVQVRQELECQRHNFEASKNSMETKFKEAETILKADLKFQTEACVGLEKELDEFKNKYQQETTQSSKKIDVLTLQLNKSEQTKNQLEQDLKRLELRMNITDKHLNKKDEQIEEFLKTKNTLEMNYQSVQAQKCELEKICSNLQRECLSLQEQAKYFQLQLENNIKQLEEKDTCLMKVKKDIDDMIHTNSNLQSKIKEIENNLNVSKKESSALRMQVDKLTESEINLKSTLQQSIEDRKSLQDKLKQEAHKIQKLELDLQKMDRSAKVLQNEITGKNIKLEDLSSDMKQTKDQFQVTVTDLQNKISSLLFKNGALENDLKSSVSRETDLKEKLKILQSEKDKLYASLQDESNKSLKLEEVMKEKENNIKMLKGDLTKLISELESLKKAKLLAEEQYMVTMKDLEERIASASTDLTNMREEVDVLKTKKSELEKSIGVLEKENSDVLEQLKVEVDKNKNLTSNAEELKENCSEKERINQENVDLIHKNEITIKQLEKDLSDALANIEKQSAESLKEKSLLENSLKALEKEKSELDDKLVLTTEEKSTHLSKILACEKELNELRKNVASKSEEIDEVAKERDILLKENEVTVNKLKQELIEVQAALEEQSNKYMKEKSLLEVSIKTLEKEKSELNDKLALHSDERNKHLSEIETFETRLSELQSISALKSEEVDKLTKEKSNIIQENEAALKQLEQKLCDAQATLEKQSTESLKEKSLLEDTIRALEEEKSGLNDKVALISEERIKFESELHTLEKELSELRKMLSLKSDEVSELTKEKANLLQGNEIAMKQLEQEIADASMALLEQSNEYLKEKSVLEDSLKTLEKEKRDLNDKLVLYSNEKNKYLSDFQAYEEKQRKLEEIIALKSEENSKLNKDNSSVLEENKVAITELETKLSEAHVSLKILEDEKNSETEKFSSACEEIKKHLAEIEKLQENIIELKQIISLNNDEVTKLNDEKTVLVEENKLIFKKLEEKIFATSAELAVVQNKVDELVVENSNLAESINKLQDEKKIISKQLLSETEKNKALTSCTEEFKIQFEVEKRNLENKISNLHHDCVSLKQKLEQEVSGKKLLEEEIEKLKSCSSTLNDKLHSNIIQISEITSQSFLCEDEKQQLSAKLEKESINVETLSSVLDSIKKKLQHQQEELIAKNNEVVELKQQIMNMENKHKTELETVTSEKTLLKKQLDDSLLNIHEIKEAVNVLNEKKLTLEKDLAIEVEHSVKIGRRLEHFEVVALKLAEDLARIDELYWKEKLEMENHFEELENSLIASQAEAMQLQEQLNVKQSSINDLLADLESERENSNVYELEKLKLQNTLQTLKADMTHISNLLEEADCKIEFAETEYEKELKAGKKELSSKLEQYEVLNSLLQESLSNQDMLKGNIHSLEEENLKINHVLNLEIEKSNGFEKRIKELDGIVDTLQTDLNLVSNDLKQKEENLHLKEEMLKELENKLHTTHSDYKIIDQKYHDCLAKEISLCLKVTVLESEKTKLDSSLQAREMKEKDLLLECENLTQTVALLQQTIENYEEKLAIIPKYEDKIEILENQLSELDSQHKVVKDNLKEVLAEAESLKTELTSVENERKVLISDLNAKVEKVSALECSLKELSETLNSFKEQNAIISTQLSTNEEEIDKYKEKITVLENQLSELESQHKVVKDNLNEVLAEGENLKTELTSVENEKEILISDLKVKDEKVSTLECSLKELSETLNSFKEQDTIKSTQLSTNEEEIDKFKKCWEDLNADLSSLQKKHDELLDCFKKSSANEESLMKNIQTLESKISYLLLESKTKSEKIEELEFCREESNVNELVLKEELALKTEELNKATNFLTSMNGYQITMKDIWENIDFCLMEAKHIIKLDPLNKFSEYVPVIDPRLQKSHSRYLSEDCCGMKNWLEDTKFCLEMMENLALTQLYRCKFLFANQIIEKENLKKLFQTAAFLKRKLLQIRKLMHVTDIIFAISNFQSAKEKLDACAASMKLSMPSDNESFHRIIVNDTESFLHVCEVNTLRISAYTVKKIQKYLKDMKINLSFIQQYNDISISEPHLPVIQSINSIIYVSRFNNNTFMHKLDSNSLYDIPLSSTWNYIEKIIVGNILQNIDARDASSLLNAYCSFNDMVSKSANIVNFKNILYLCVSKILIPIFIGLFNGAKRLPILEELPYWADIEAFISSPNVLIDSLADKVANDGITYEIYETLSIISSLQILDSLKQCGEMNEKCATFENEKLNLEVTVKREKEKQCLLNSTIEEIENDLSETFMEKEKFCGFVKEIGQLIKYLKDISNHVNTDEDSNFNFEAVSKICLCEECLLHLGNSVNHNSNAEILSLETFIHWGKNVMCSNQNLKLVIEKQQQNLQEFCEEKEKLLENISEFKNKYETTSMLLAKKESAILNLESDKNEFNAFFEKCQKQLHACEEQLCKISADRDVFKLEVTSKEEDIKILKKTIKEKNIDLESKILDCKNFENESNKLKNAILLLEQQISEVTNEKDTVINKLKNKTESLQQSTDSLNLTIKSIEKELQMCFAEKLTLEDKLNNVIQEADSSKKDIQKWQNLYESEKQTSFELISKIRELEMDKSDTKQNYSNLTTKLESLKNDVSVLKNLQREHEDILLEKNHSLNEKDETIQQLQANVNEKEINNSNLKLHLIQTEELKESLESEVKEAHNKIYEFESKIKNLERENSFTNNKLHEIESEKEVLKKEIKDCHQKLDDYTLLKNVNSELKNKLEAVQNALDKENKLKIVQKNKLKLYEKKLDDLNSCITKLQAENEKLKEKDGENKQKITHMTKDILSSKLTLTMLEEKFNDLSAKHNKLSSENGCNLSNASELKDVKHALSNAMKFISSLFDIILEVVKDESNSTLTEELQNCLQSINFQTSQNSMLLCTGLDISPNLLKDLRLFLESNVRSLQEELKIVNLISSMGNVVSDLKQFVETLPEYSDKVEGIRNKISSWSNCSMNMTFTETCDFANIYSHSEVLKELQQMHELLKECFSFLKNIIMKQTKELKEIKSKVSVQLPPNNSELEEVKKKYQFIRMNYKKLEQSAIGLKNLSLEQSEKLKSLNKEKIEIEEDLKKQIATLTKEKAELDTEAEELANDYKKLQEQRYEDYSNILEAGNLKDKLKEYEEEIKKLKSCLEKCNKQPLGKENKLHK